MKTITFFIAFSLLASVAVGQTAEERQEIIKNTDVRTLQELKLQFEAEASERSQRISSFLSANPNFKKRVVSGFAIQELYDIDENGEPIYFRTSNFNGARTTRADRLYSGGSLGLNIQGQGMTAYVWDGGGSRATHVEFPGDKVSNLDGAEMVDHATHVMGTIVAQGITSTLRGAAFNASGMAYDWNSDYAEMATEAANGMLVSNHSYWIGNNSNAWIYGAYDTRARQFDQVAVAAPFYLAVTAAGNDRNDFSDDILSSYLSLKGGYNLTRGMQNAKNYLTVGAVSQVLNYQSPQSVVMSDFSSWGPTDDGRIKPEVVAKGVNVRSTLTASDTSNGIESGTSMASPGVAGVALLLQQYYNSIKQTYLRAATLKGLIMHTADEAGPDVGPDYMFGWGLVNAERAANTITNSQNQSAMISELNLLNGNSYSIAVAANGTTPLSASISWTDPAASSQNSGTNDPTTIYLSRDLDIRITKDNEVFFPWTLDPANPADSAVRTADNFRDNFEKVQVDNPSGTYTITVTHKGTLPTSGSTAGQRFSLIVTGPSLVLNNEDINRTKPFVVYPNPSKGFINVGYEATTDRVLIQLFDISGRIVKTLDSAALNNSIDISDLANGVYVLKCNDGNKSVSQKIVLSK